MARLLRKLLDPTSRHPWGPASRGGRAPILTFRSRFQNRRRPMTDLATLDTYGSLIEPTTLKIERTLPGPIERVWAYLTESELRRRWLASGDMELKVGAPFELVWRNDELTDPPGERPPGFSGQHQMESRILEVDPPRRLAFTFGSAGEVSFDLATKGKEVLLTLIHR